jgi:glycolate oxidase iron-sulfur subunit
VIAITVFAFWSGVSQLMKTSFKLSQLADRQVAESERILRTCVHCGFCTATCPTYVLLGDELDSPRGRIYLIKDMLENERPASTEVVKHIDRCLSCLSCMTTCPSGVHYMHLVDHARIHIERTYRRPWRDRVVREFIAAVLPHPGRLRFMTKLAALCKPLAPLLEAAGWPALAAMLRLNPSRMPSSGAVAPAGDASAPRRGRVAMLTGCANDALAPAINSAAIRLLDRLGVAVVRPQAAGCCGALTFHLGREHESLEFARRNVDAWTREIEGEGLDAILITASGCGTTVKDYGFMLRDDPHYAKKAERVAALAKDISEYLAMLEIVPVGSRDVVVAYHAACSLQHGQKITREPKELLARAGFTVREVPEGHLCCGSAGTYNMLQPVLARRLALRKAANIEKVAPDVIATGNLGCMTQLATATDVPIVHTVELLDWATGGPPPDALKASVARERTGSLAPVA